MNDFCDNLLVEAFTRGAQYRRPSRVHRADADNRGVSPSITRGR